MRPRGELARALWGLAAVCTLLTALTWSPWLVSITERLVPFRVHAAVAGLVAAAMAGALTRRGPLVVAWVLLAVVNGAWAWPRVSPGALVTRADRPLRVHPLTVVTYNVNTSNTDYDAGVEILHKCGADVIVLEELTPGWKDALVRLEGYTYRSMYPDDDFWGFGVLSRYPITSSEVLPWTELASHYGVHVRIRIGREAPGRGLDVDVFGVHTLTPVNTVGATVRDAQLADLAARVRATPGVVVVIGDFNTVPWSRQFNTLLRDGGLVDGAAGRGLLASWPKQLGVLGLPIDHVLTAGRAQVDELEVLGAGGSDHSAVYAKVAVWGEPAAP